MNFLIVIASVSVLVAFASIFAQFIVDLRSKKSGYPANRDDRFWKENGDTWLGP